MYVLRDIKSNRKSITYVPYGENLKRLEKHL